MTSLAYDILIDENEEVMILLSIVLVNSDGKDDTIRCLESIYRHPPACEFEVILVDNCSSDSCLTMVRDHYPEVTTMSAPQRQGFAKNVNLGIRHARGQYVLVLNNDTIIHQGALDSLVHAAIESPSYGILGPKLLSSDGSIQTVCARSLITPLTYVVIMFLLDLALPTGKLWDRYRRWRISKMTGGPVPCISGACMLVTRDALNKVGMLDEEYDFYYEDIEWCHRVQKAGLLVGYHPGAVVTHLGDRSLSKVKEWAKQSEYRSAMRYFQAYHGLSRTGLWSLWAATVLGYGMRAFLYRAAEVLTGRESHGQAYLNLARWAYRQKPNGVNIVSAGTGRTSGE